MKTFRHKQIEDNPNYGIGVVVLNKAISPLIERKDGYGYLGVVLYDKTTDKVQCPECGKWFKSISWSHARIHGFSIDEIKERHGLFKNTSLWGPLMIENQMKRIKRTFKTIDLIKFAERMRIGRVKKFKNINYNSRMSRIQKNKKKPSKIMEQRNKTKNGGTCFKQIWSRLGAALMIATDGKYWVSLDTLVDKGIHSAIRKYYKRFEDFEKNKKKNEINPYKQGTVIKAIGVKNPYDIDNLLLCAGLPNLVPIEKGGSASKVIKSISANGRKSNMSFNFRFGKKKVCFDKKLLASYIRDIYVNENRLPSAYDWGKMIPSRDMYEKRFGGVVKAIEYALSEKEIEDYRKSHFAGVKKEMINDLVSFYRVHNRLPRGNEAKISNGLCRWKTYSKRFKSWKNALDLAEDKIKNIYNIEYVPRVTRMIDNPKEDILFNLFEFYKRKNRFPSYKELRKNISGVSYSGLYKIFRKLSIAIKECKIKYKLK